MENKKGNLVVFVGLVVIALLMIGTEALNHINALN